MSKILVTGASGLLGLNLCVQASVAHEVTGVVHEHVLRTSLFHSLQMDLSQPGQINALFDQTKPEVVIHCAALANLDGCEQRPELAQRLNVDLTAEIAGACAQRGVRLIFISTDAVFDGQRGDYVETDLPHPINTYARTKLEAEQAVERLLPGALIARVNFYGWSLSGERGLGEWFYNNLAAGRKIKGFTDVMFCPLVVNDLAGILLELDEKRAGGIFHIVSSECVSKYAFGVQLAELFGLDKRLISPAAWVDVGLKAPRSPNLILRTEKLAAALSRPAPDVTAGLRRFNRELAQDLPHKLRSMSRKA